MFRKSPKDTQLSLFSNLETGLKGKTLNNYINATAWHNLFREQITMRIDEHIFSVLFCQDNGAPNASIRVLIAMMIIKEAKGWSDSELFENCRYNILIRCALGLLNIDDDLPTESTYYAFRKKIVEYHNTKNIDLMEQVFATITKKQIAEFNVSGKAIRMDSKLLGSNIAWCSRYELVHETLRLFILQNDQLIKEEILSEEDKQMMSAILKESGNKVVYRSTQDEVFSQLKVMGVFIYKMLNLLKGNASNSYKMLQRVFNEQFEVIDYNSITPKDKTAISPKSMQSPHDQECTYRDKDGNKIKGYSLNLTETCDKSKENEPQPLNLIVDIKADIVSTPDTEFLVPAVKKSNELLSNNIEQVHSDGAYYSYENQTFCDHNIIHFITTAIQAKESRFYLSLNRETNELIVCDKDTCEEIIAEKIISRKDPDQLKWRIKLPEGKTYRYFTMKEITACEKRYQIRHTAPEELYTRNNVEASIMQLGYHYANDKSRYRGLYKHQMWATSRVLWINLRRIMKYLGKLCFFDKIMTYSAYSDLLFLFFTDSTNPFQSLNRPFSKIIPNYALR